MKIKPMAGNKDEEEHTEESVYTCVQCHAVIKMWRIIDEKGQEWCSQCYTKIYSAGRIGDE